MNTPLLAVLLGWAVSLAWAAWALVTLAKYGAAYHAPSRDLDRALLRIYLVGPDDRVREVEVQIHLDMAELGGGRVQAAILDLHPPKKVAEL